MSRSSALKTIIQTSLEVVQAHPLHDLPLGYRQAIWAAFGPRLKKNQTRETTGHKKRTHLAILSARHVLPIWQGIRGDDTTPEDLLEMAEDVLKGRIPAETARKKIGDAWLHMDRVVYQGKEAKPASVGYAAICALNTALRDELFNADKINYDLTDEDVDPYAIDASYSAAVAYANGRLKDPNSDPARRLEFWTWWLGISNS